MALKGDMVPNRYNDDLRFFMNQTAERGAIVSISTAGSGVANENASNVVAYASSASGKRPVGILLCDVVNLDLTRQQYNPHKNEVQYGSKVHICKAGTFTTNMVTSGITPSAGDTAYLAADGRITNVNTGAVASPPVGYFETVKDEDGYATVRISL